MMTTAGTTRSARSDRDPSHPPVDLATMVHSPVGLDELSRRCGMSTVDLNELVDYCALVPLTATANEFAFSVDWLGPLQAAGKMRRDFDLDLFTVAILLGNLNRIDCLERQVQTLQARLPSQGAA